MYTSYDKNLSHFFEALKQSHSCSLLQSEFWITRLQYLASIFQHLSILNSCMQGREENIVTSTDKIKVFRKKLQIWKRTAIEGCLKMFPLVINNCKTEVFPLIVEHLSTLEEKWSYYFPLINTAQYDWIGNPFVKSAIYSSLMLTEEEELEAVSTGHGLMIKLKELSLEAFWMSIKEENVSISNKALAIFIAIFHLIFM